jgi:hypothetical protein
VSGRLQNGNHHRANITQMTRDKNFHMLSNSSIKNGDAKSAPAAHVRFMIIPLIPCDVKASRYILARHGLESNG